MQVTETNISELTRCIPGYDPWATSGDCVFGIDAALFAVNFVQTLCRHVKGELAGELIDLEAWQVAIFANLFGWKRPDGTRRYREALVYIPRGNSKTTMAAAIVLVVLFGDDEGGAELYSAAADREQARLCFEIVGGMVRQEPSLNEAAKIFRNSITVADRSYKALSSDAGTKHGTSPQLVVNDELHAHKSAELTETLLTGQGKRRQPLAVHLTTADFERASICNSKRDYAAQVRDGLIDELAFLPVIYEADIAEDWSDPEVWRKANPNYGVSVTHDYLARESSRAAADPAYLNTFRRLHLNMKTSTLTSCIELSRWDAADDRRPESELLGRECYGGLDVASKSDINAFVLAFPDGPAVDLLCWFWVPEAAADKNKRDSANRGHYHGWASQGYLELVPGERMEQALIASTVRQQAKRFRIKELAYDPWNCESLRLELESDGLPMLEFHQQMRHFTEPFKEYLAKISAGQIRHGGNPVLRWMAGNLAATEDPAGNIRPDKGKSRDKIDGQIATVMALGASMFAPKHTEAFFIPMSSV